MGRGSRDPASPSLPICRVSLLGPPAGQGSGRRGPTQGHRLILSVPDRGARFLLSSSPQQSVPDECPQEFAKGVDAVSFAQIWTLTIPACLLQPGLTHEFTSSIGHQCPPTHPPRCGSAGWPRPPGHGKSRLKALRVRPAQGCPWQGAASWLRHAPYVGSGGGGRGGRRRRGGAGNPSSVPPGPPGLAGPPEFSPVFLFSWGWGTRLLPAGGLTVGIERGRPVIPAPFGELCQVWGRWGLAMGVTPPGLILGPRGAAFCR